MQKNTVIFDMDGVLIDSEPFWRQVQITQLQRYGITISEQDCIQYTMGKRLDDLASTWCQRFKLPTNAVDLAEAISQGMVDCILSKGEALPGVHSLLDYLTEHSFQIGLATSSSQPLIEAVLDRLAIRHHFHIVCSAEAEAYGKPHPGVYLTAAAKLNAEPAQCIVIEDSVTGMIAAKAAMMTTLVVPEDTEDPRFSLAEHIYKDLDSLRHSYFSEC